MAQIGDESKKPIQADKLFSCLASDLRHKILQQLVDSPKQPSEISKINSVSPTEIFRNVKKLEESMLVKKSSSGQIMITPSGLSALKVIPFFTCISKYNYYFNQHDLDSIPKEFIQTLGVLANCSIVSGSVNVIEQIRNIVDDSKEFLLVVAPQISPDTMEYKFQTKPNLPTKLILGDNSIIPPRAKDIMKKYFQNYAIYKSHTFRQVKKLDFFLRLSEKSAGFSFYEPKQGTFMNSMMFGTDPEFLDWCKKLFEYYWSRAYAIKGKELF